MLWFLGRCNKNSALLLVSCDIIANVSRVDNPSNLTLPTPTTIYMSVYKKGPDPIPQYLNHR